jgi:hypothetical protein
VQGRVGDHPRVLIAHLAVLECDFPAGHDSVGQSEGHAVADEGEYFVPGVGVGYVPGAVQSVGLVAYFDAVTDGQFGAVARWAAVRVCTPASANAPGAKLSMSG